MSAPGGGAVMKGGQQRKRAAFDPVESFPLPSPAGLTRGVHGSPAQSADQVRGRRLRIAGWVYPIETCANESERERPLHAAVFICAGQLLQRALSARHRGLSAPNS
jgi:hypothetical protein